MCDSGEIIDPIPDDAQVFTRMRDGDHESLDLSATQQFDRFSFRELPRVVRIETCRHENSTLRVFGHKQSIKFPHLHHGDPAPRAQSLALDEANLALAT